MASTYRSILAVLLVLILPVSIAAQGDVYSQTIETFKKSTAVKPSFANAYGYAVFPTIGKGGVGVGGAYGRGKVYEYGQITGTAELFKAIIGFQKANRFPNLSLKRQYNALLSG